MIGFLFSLLTFACSFVLLILLIVQQYQGRIDAAREETEMWKRKAGGLDRGAE